MQLLAIGLYALVLLAIGVIASRRTHGLVDYYAGGKRQGYLAAAFSARATGESGWLLLGLTGFGAIYGLKGFWIVAGEVLGVALAWIFMARRFKRLTDRYDSITMPDYLESRFRDPSHYIRFIAAGSLLVFVPIYVSSQIHATGEAFHSFLGWNYYAGALAGFAIVLFYVTTGGFIAVVWSDVFQALLMVAGLVILPIAAILSAGGVDPLLNVLRTDFPELLSWSAGEGWTLHSAASIIGFLGIGLGFLGSPQVFVRLISLKSEHEIPAGTVVALLWTIMADSGAVLVGFFGRALLTGDLGTGGQDVLPLLVEHLMPPFLAGLYIAIVLAAIMSTIDSLLVVASSAAVRDYYQRIFHPTLPDDSLGSMTRKLTVVLALVSLLIAMSIAILTGRQGVFWYIIFGWSGIAATFCPTVILSLFWRGMSSFGACCAMVAGFLAIPFFNFIAPNLPVVGGHFDVMEEMFPSFVVSFLAGYLGSKLHPPSPELRASISAELDQASM